MEILKGQVQWNGRDDIPCTYGKMEDGRQYYFKQELVNGNVIVTTQLIEYVDPMTKAKNVGLINKDGMEIIPCVNTAITPISNDILLVEPAIPVSQNVVEANSLRLDPLSATKLVSIPAQIKEKINAKMSNNGRYKLNDQFKDGTICDIDGNNLVNNEYYSFIALDGDKLFMAKNNPETDVLEFNITDKKFVEEVNTESVVDTVMTSTEPVQEVVETPVEEVQPVQDVVTPIENVNEGFAKEDIDLGQEITIPAVEENIPVENVVTPINPIQEEASNDNIEVGNVGSESFDEIKEETPVAEINNDEVEAEIEDKELTEEDLDDRESELERRLNELNEKFNNMNEQITNIAVKEEDTKDMEEEAKEEDVFTTPEVDSIDEIEEGTDEYDEIDEVVEDDIKDTTMEDATKALDALAQKYNEKNIELNEALEREEKLKASRKNYIEKAKAQEQKITLLNTKNHELMETNTKLEAKIESLNIASDLQKRKNEEQKRRIGELERENMRLSTQVEGKEELARALESVKALLGENSTYDDDSYYKKVA